MTDDRTTLEVRLHDSFRRDALPTAPPSLFEALERVAETAASRPAISTAPRRISRPPWSLVGIAAVATLGLVWQLFALAAGGRPPVAPPPAPSPSAPAAATRITYEPIWTTDVPEDPAVLARSAGILQRRLDSTGIVGATAVAEARTVVVEFPAGVDTNAVRRLLGQTGHLSFAPVGEAEVSRGMPLDEATYPALFGSEHVTNATVDIGQVGDAVLRFRFDLTGSRLFADYTRTHVGSSIAFALDGIVVAAPRIMSEIPNGDLQISFGQSEAPAAAELLRLATIIRLGPLPVPIKEVAAAIGSQEAGPTPAIAPLASDASLSPS